MKRIFTFTLVFFLATQFSVAQYVGIGTATPNHPLTVVSTSDGIVSKSGTVEVGTYVTPSAAYLQTYSNHPLYFSTNDGNAQISLLVNGNVGIGTTAPAYKLDVSGALHTTGDVVAGSDVNVTGDVTVQGGKGIIRAVNSGQLKYYTRTAAFTAIIGAFGTSAEGSIAFSSGIFTSPPQVIVGNITSTGGTVGELYRVQLVIYDVTTTSCHCRLINTSNGAVNYDITWNIICIGN